MMLSNELRVFLYPLGILSTFAFTFRFVIQWLQSERRERSIVTASFWRLSLLGNGALGLHSLIQGQYPICVIQAINGVIACRNLNLMQPSFKQWKFRSVIAALVFSILLPTLLFWVYSPDDWLRIPTHSFQNFSDPLPSFYHFLGVAGVLLFASRFWIQWIQAEKSDESSLERSFWWLSLIGALLSITYFGMIFDYVNLIGPLFGLIPYSRNLILLRKAYAKK